MISWKIGNSYLRKHTFPQTVFSRETPDTFSQLILFSCIAFIPAAPGSGGGGGGAGGGGGGGGGGIMPGGGNWRGSTT